ncbi:MAG TPA: glycosyltransferase [Candidatus Dormibacteraeota bacterium]|nr:glycosyltransferase [Candidatus Dormibacteraeota bacterium]
MSDHTMPDEPAPDQVIPAPTAPDELVLDQAMPMEAIPDALAPDEVTPEVKTPASKAARASVAAMLQPLSRLVARRKREPNALTALDEPMLDQAAFEHTLPDEQAPIEATPVQPKLDRTKFVVSALIVSHDNKPQLLQCLRALYSTADVPVEAVVVDNASNDGSAAAVTDEFPQVTVLRESENLGYGRAANKGFERVRGRFVLLLTPDVTMEPQAVGRLADFLLTRPDAGAVGPRIVMPDGTLDPEARQSFPVPRSLFYRTVGLSRMFPNSPRFGSHNMGHVEETDVHEIDSGTATCLMLRTAAIDRIGFFDPRYFMYSEDIDLCYRMKMGGWKIFYLPSATALRHETQPTSEVQRKALYEKHRSMWAYHFKHHAEDVPAFGNGLVWAQIWGRWAAKTVKDTVSRPRRARRVES